MNKKYYLLYLRNTQNLKNLINSGDDASGENIKLLDLPFNRFFDSLGEDQRESLFAYLKKRLHLFDGTDGGNTKIGNLSIPNLNDPAEEEPTPLSLAEALDMGYPEKSVLISDLKQILKEQIERNDEVELKKNIAKLLESVETSRNQMLSIDRDIPNLSIKETFTIPIGNVDIPSQIVSMADERLFDFNAAQHDAYCPTESQTLNTSVFDNLSRKEIIALFEPENFYALKKDGAMRLLQAAANEYLRSQDVEPCAVVFENLTLNDRKIQRGEYDPNRGAIILNKRILDQFDNAKADGDPEFAYQLLSTVIHEAQHRSQFFMRTNKKKLTKKDTEIINALECDQRSLSHSQYLALSDELDARNAALQYMKDGAQELSSPSLMKFYNKKKKQEKQNGKREISSEKKAYFGCIYDDEYFYITKDGKKILKNSSSSDAEPGV